MMGAQTIWKRLLAFALAATVLAALAVGCASVKDDSAESAAGTGSSTSTTDSGASPDQGKDATSVRPATGTTGTGTDGARLVVLTRTVELEVESTSETVDAIRDLTRKNGGTITDLHVASETDEWVYRQEESGASSGSGTALKGWITVRIPADAVEAFSADVMALGTVKYQSEASQDVTQEHVDLTARLQNLKAEEARLREFFASAKTVADMLAVETELSRVRGEIESLDAQIAYLERQAAQATVTIDLTERQPVVRPSGDTWGFRDAVTRGFQGAADVVTFAITILIAALPIWGPALVVLLVVLLVQRSRRLKRLGVGVPASKVGETAAPGGGTASTPPPGPDFPGME